MSSSLELNRRPQKLPPWTQLQEKGEEPTAREEAEDEGTETGGGPEPRKLGGSIPGREGAPGYPSMEGGRPTRPPSPGAGGIEGIEGMGGIEDIGGMEGMEGME